MLAKAEQEKIELKEEYVRKEAELKENQEKEL